MPAMLIWSALWRAQVVHLGVFVVLPALAAMLQIALGVVLLPFQLIGEGRQELALTGPIHHLAQPGCWVALLPCSLGDRAIVVPTRSANSVPPQNRPTPKTAEEPEPFMPLPTALTIRHAWLIALLTWFGVFLVRRERRRSR
jgi:hypothetical protein